MKALAHGLATACHRWAVPIIALSLAFLVSCPFLLRGLRLDADTARLVGTSDPLGAAYRKGKLYHGESNPLVVQLVFPGVERSLVDAFTARLVETLEAEEDILAVETGAAQLLDGEDAPLRLRAALLNSRPPLLEELGARLSEAGLRRALRRARKRLVSVDDIELRRLISDDVLDLRGLIAPYYRERIAFLPGAGPHRYYDAPDGASRLLFVRPEGSSEDSAYCRGLLNRIETEATRLRSELGGAEAIALRFTGVHAITAESAETLMQDMTRITAAATVLLLVLLWLSFGRLRVAIICFYPLLVSLGAVLVLARTLFNPVNYLTIGFAAIVIGLGVDVGLHLTARLLHFARQAGAAEALRLTYRDSGPPVVIGITSTAAAFLALAFSGNRGLTQFGLLTAAGLMVSLAITLVVFPAVVRYLAPSGDGSRLSVWWIPGRLFRLGASHPLPALALSLVLALAGLGLARDFRFDMDLQSLIPEDLRAVKLADEIAEGYDVSFASLLQVEVEAESGDAALTAQRRLDDELEELLREGAVAGFRSPSELLVYPRARTETAALRETVAGALRQQKGTYFTLLEELRFRPSHQHQRTYALMEDAVGDEQPGWGPELRRFAVDAGGHYRLQTAVWPAAKAVPAQRGDAAATRDVARRLQGLPTPPGVSLQVTGILLVYERMNEMLREAFFETSWIAALLVAGLALLYFRSPTSMLLSLVPLAAALPATIGFIAAAGIPFAPSAIAFGAVIVGIGIDDAVHILARCPKGSADGVGAVMEEMGPVITLTTLSTVIGFGSLGLARLPVVSSLGLVIAIGVVACWVFAVLLLPALLTLLGRRGLGRAAAVGAILLSSSLGAHGQEPSAESILTRLAGKLEGIEAASCTFEQTKLISQLAGEFRGSGTLLFQKPHFLKMTLTGDENMAVYCNGETLWVVDRDLEEVTKLPFAAGAAQHQLQRLLPPLLFSDLEDLKGRFNIRYGGKQDGLELLEFQPVNVGTSPVRSMRLMIDGRDRLRRTSVEYVNGDRLETAYSDWKTLDRVSPHAFVFYGEREAEE